MNQDQLFIDWLKSHFGESRQVESYLQGTTAPDTIVCESEEQGNSCFFENNRQDGFIVKNPTGKHIHLFSLDGCFFNPNDGKRCDCLVFDAHCCFVELKMRVTRRQGSQKSSEAREQLGGTIRFFEAAVMTTTSDFFGLSREAYIVMQTNVYPRRSAARETIFVQFLQRYKVPLFELNEKEF